MAYTALNRVPLRTEQAGFGAPTFNLPKFNRIREFLKVFSRWSFSCRKRA